jgi:hypothetical protein
MFTALYYPHTAIQDEHFLKHALLYWDEIEYISPFQGFDPSRHYRHSALGEALRITKPHLPTPEEKKRAHKLIMELVEEGLPEWLQVNRRSINAEEGQLYAMYRNKLLPETWAALEELGLAQPNKRGDFDDYMSHTYLGLTIMAILARCCAGALRHTITDRDESYLSLTRFIQSLDDVNDLNPRGRRSGKGVSWRWLNALGMAQSQTEQELREVLITITLDVIDTKSIPLDALLELRSDKRKFTAELRQNYAKAIQDCVKEVTAPDRTLTDVKFLIEEFRQRMHQDLVRLYGELRPLGFKTVLSKEVAVAVIAPIVGSTALIASGGPILGGVIGVGALGKLATEYKSARDAVFQRHPMAFLYASKGVRLY